MHRIRRALSDALFEVSEDQLSRVKAIPGDISKPLLGLSHDLYSWLAQEVSVVYHCGAYVHGNAIPPLPPRSHALPLKSLLFSCAQV